MKIISPTLAPLLVCGQRRRYLRHFQGYLFPTATPGVFDNHETALMTGGTGRFANATGHFDLGGQLDFTTTAVLCSPLARDDLQCRLDEAALDIVRLICASQLAFVWLRCARSAKGPAASRCQAASHRRNKPKTAPLVIRSRLTDRTGAGPLSARLQIFFATRRKVSGRNGKRSASPDSPGTTTINPNSKKENHMKNRSIQLK